MEAFIYSPLRCIQSIILFAKGCGDLTRPNKLTELGEGKETIWVRGEGYGLG